MTYCASEWKVRLYSRAYAIRYYRVTKEEEEFVYRTGKRNRLNEDEIGLLKHLTASTLQRIRGGQHYDALWVPMASAFIDKYFPDAYYRKLRRKGLIEVSGYCSRAGKSREYRLTTTFLDHLSAITRDWSAEHYHKAKKVNLITGNPAYTSRQARKEPAVTGGTDNLPPTYLEAVRLISEAGRPVNISAMEAMVQERKAHMDQLRQEHGPEDLRFLKAQAQWRTDHFCLQAVIDHSKKLADGGWVYYPRYRPTSSGRTAELNGGLQSCSRKLKQASIEGVGDLLNIDMVASQINCLVKELSLAGIDATVWRNYLSDPIAKARHASSMGVGEDMWKTCLLSIIFGATIPTTFPALLSGRAQEATSNRNIRYKSALLQILYDAAGENLIRAQDLLSRFTTVVQPFRQSIRQWHKYLLKQYVRDPTVTKTVNERVYVRNQLGFYLCLSDLGREKSRKLAAL